MNPTQPVQRQSNQSSMRLLQIMECLAENRTPMRLQDLAKQTGMTQSTVLRYLYALLDAHYIYQDADTSRYALTWRVCRLSSHLNSQIGLRNMAAPFISHLANSLALGACLVVNQDDACMYLDCIDNPNSPGLQRIGKLAPLHATGSGKVLLSQYSEPQLTEYIRTRGLTCYTEYTITDPALLRKELDRVREQGFGMDEQECELNLRCISLPLRDYSGNIIAAMSLFGNLTDMDPRRIREEIYPPLKAAAEAVSSRLGFIPEEGGHPAG